MSEMQDAINQILSNPEAMKQVQSLGEQLGLSKPAPKPEPKNEMLGAMQSLAPLMGRLMKLIKVIPLIKDSGLLF